MNVTRRSLLAALAALPASRALAGPLGSGREDAALAEVIRAVGGLSAIPDILVEGCAAAFRKHYGDEAVPALLQAVAGQPLDDLGPPSAAQNGLSDQDLEDQLRWIAAFLYTGEITRDDGSTSVAWYPWALAWSGLGFATAPGLCGMPFGHWQDAPVNKGPA